MVAATVVVLSIVRDDGDPRRTAVANYIADVNRIEIRHADEVKQANATYRGLDLTASAPARQQTSLARAERTLESLRGDYRALVPPADAEKLDRLLLELADAQVAFTRELAAIVRYLPELDRRERWFAVASRRLQRDLTQRKGDAAAAAAFTRYATSVGATTRAIAALDSPPAMAARERERVSELRRLARLAGEVAVALREEDAFAAERASRDLARAASGFADPAVARRRVVAGYNRRLRELAALRADVARERDRLDASLDA